MSEELLEELKKNPHFKALPDILTQEGVDQDAFMYF